MVAPSRNDQVAALMGALEVLNGAGKERDVFPPLLYKPPLVIGAEIGKLRDLVKRQESLNKVEQALAGQLMERIAFLAFGSLAGVATIKSFQSAGPQHDLWLEGSDVGWLAVCKYVRFDESKRGILVEAKATKGKVGDPQFARLGAVLNQNFPDTGALGVFLTIKGATGFPDDGKQRQRKIGAARLRQLILYHRFRLPVVVLTWKEIEELATDGALVRILERGVRDIQELSGQPLWPVTARREVDLPAHIEELMVALDSRLSAGKKVGS